jgi:L-malate glycosyltransferase
MDLGGRSGMTIGIAGPVDIGTLQEYLYHDCVPQGVAGMGGTPVNQLIVSLLERGYTVHAFSLDRALNEPVVLRGPKLTLHMAPYRPRGRARDLFAVERRHLVDAIRRTNPDILHAHWTYEFAWAALSSGVPTLITIRDWAPRILRYDRSAYRIARLLMNYVVLRRGTEFTANSKYIQTQYRRKYRREIPVIPNALPDDVFATNTRRYPAIPHRIVSINNGFGRLKNTKVLLEAFNKLRMRGIQVGMELIGKGYEPRGCAHRWAQERGLTKSVDFVGSIPHREIGARLENASLLIHPSLEESFGYTLLEAMSKRVPVLGGISSGAVPWVLSNGKAGKLVDVRNADDIAGVASELLSSEREWLTVSEAGYEHAYKHFRQSLVTSMYLDAYRTIIVGR